MFSKTYTGSFAQKAVSIISLFVLVVGVFPATVAANHNDNFACNEERTYTFSSGGQNGGDDSSEPANIDYINNGNRSGNPDSITVSADTGYVVTKVEVTLDDDNLPGYVTIATGPITNFDPAGSTINGTKVTVKKLCFDVTINETLACGSGSKNFSGTATYAGDTSTRLRVTFNPPGSSNTTTEFDSTSEPATWSFTKNVTAGQSYTIEARVYDDSDAESDDIQDTATWTFTVPNCPPADTDSDSIPDTTDNCPTVANTNQLDSDNDGIGNECDQTPNGPDACPNVNGHQTSGTDCNEAACDESGDTWIEEDCYTDKEVCEEIEGGTWNDGNCYSDEQLCENAGNAWIDEDCYTPEEECEEIEEGFWTGTDCDDIEECEQGQTYNESNNTCADPEPTEAEACVLDGKFWTGSACVDIAVCTGNQTLNTETNICVNQDVPPTCAENQTLVEGQCVNNEVSPEPEAPKKNRGHIDPVCNNNVDDDKDGFYDVNDPDCADANGSSESPALGGTSEGDVLGACSAILDSYIGLRGIAADPAAVKVLQTFLNKELGRSLEVNGEYDAATIEAVKAFQAKYSIDVLSPWGINESTGIVFKTTQRMINKIACPTLDIPMPELN